MNKEYAKSNLIGVDDFKVLLSEYYYVDKSKLIEEIINKGSQKSYLLIGNKTICVTLTIIK